MPPDTAPGDERHEPGSWVWAVDDAAVDDPDEGEPLLSLHLARRLRDAGLEWEPRQGDRFLIPEAQLDEHTFLISPMSVDVRRAPGGQILTFNGAVEWALDAIRQQEVVWLPTEGQLRERLGERFRALRRVDGRFRCRVALDGDREHEAMSPRAVDAYGWGLLAVLRGAPADLDDPAPEAS